MGIEAEIIYTQEGNYSCMQTIQVQRRVRNAFVRTSGRAERMAAAQMCYCRFKAVRVIVSPALEELGEMFLNTSLPGVDAPCPGPVLIQTGCRNKGSAARHLAATVLLFTKARLGSLLIL